jgi:hypothetical protein
MSSIRERDSHARHARFVLHMAQAADVAGGDADAVRRTPLGLQPPHPRLNAGNGTGAPTTTAAAADVHVPLTTFVSSDPVVMAVLRTGYATTVHAYALEMLGVIVKSNKCGLYRVASPSR